MLSWFALCSLAWFSKVYVAASGEFGAIFPLIRRAFPFVLYVLRDPVALNSVKQVASVKEATRYISFH